MNGPSGPSLRNGGPIGKAPHSGGSSMPQTSPVTANTVAREHPAHQTGTNTFGKEVGTFKGGGELGAKGHASL